MISFLLCRGQYTFPAGLNPKIETKSFRRGHLHPMASRYHLSHLHLLALHGSGFLHHTQLSQSPYGRRLSMEATGHQVCLIFLSLDGAHLRQRDDTMTFFIPPIKTIRGTTWSRLIPRYEPPRKHSLPVQECILIYLLLVKFIQAHNSQEYSIPNHVYKAQQKYSKHVLGHLSKQGKIIWLS